MLGIYLWWGAETLVRYYRMVPIYQVVLLFSLIICQFVTQCLSIWPKVNIWLQNLTPGFKVIFLEIGFFKFIDSQPIASLFFPYISLCFVTAYTYIVLKQKVSYEKEELVLPRLEDPITFS